MLKTLKKNISYSLPSKKNAKVFKNYDRVYFVHSPYELYPPSNSKLPFPYRKLQKEPTSPEFFTNKAIPNSKLYEKLKNFYKNRIRYHKQEISPQRYNLCKAMTTSKTIEELLHMTKVPASKIFKKSTQTGTSPRISPLKEYKLSGTLREKSIII